MRLLCLGLRPYGAYREEEPLRLDPSKRFHVLHGLNESGKTTRRAAIVDLLFDFEHRTEYAFAYETSALRVYASIEADGTVYEIERRKGRSGTLRDASGEPIPEERVRAWLGGIDRETFLTRFSFGAEELRKGAELLLSSAGNVGYSLYGAALAGADARVVLADLEREAEALFKPLGKNMPINAALARYAHFSKCVRDSLHKPDALYTLEEDAKRIAERLRAIDAEQGAAQQRSERLDAIVSVIPEHEQYRELRRAIDEAQACERVPDDALDAVRNAVERARELEQRERVVRDARERIDGNPLAVDEKLLGFAVEIDAVAAELAAIEKSLEGVRDGRIEERIRRTLERSRTLRERYWSGIEDTALREREPSRKAVAEAQKLASEHAALEASRLAAEREHEKALHEQQRLNETLGGLSSLVDTAALEVAVEGARALGDIDELLSRREAATRAQREKLDGRVAALRFIEGGTAALAERKLPLPEQIVDAVAHEQDARNRETLLHEQRTRAADALAAAERVVREHEAAGALGVTERLEAARREREECFSGVERAWRSGDPYDGEEPPRYRAAAALADRIADERYERADAVARADRALEDRDEARAELERFDAELRGASEARATFQSTWKALWEPASIVPDAPTAMREWLTRAAAVLSEFHALLDKEAEASGLRAQRDVCRAALLLELERMGHADAGDARRSVTALAARGAELLNRVRSEQIRREQMSAQRERMGAALDEAKRAREKAGEELERWRERWRAALSALFLPLETQPEAINAVLEDLRDLFDAYNAYRSESTCLESVRAEEERYRRRAAEAIAAAAPDLLPMLEHALAQAVKAAQARLKEARGNAARLVEREEQIRRAQAELDTVAAELREASQRRDAVIEAAGLRLDGIDARIAAALELRRLRAEGERLHRELRLGARCPVEEIDAEAQRAGYEGLRTDLLSVRDASAGLQEERERLIAERQKVQSAREDLDRSDVAAQAQGDLLAVGGEIDRHVRRYAALMLAKTLLEEEINRYALTHQAPILATASRYLARLTCERYRGVLVVGEGDAQAIEVLCDEGEKTVEALSDGTRDQLYLALRLSVLEEHLRAARPLPLIVDDALLTFDDKRTAAALLAFREFAQTTQVIYFTHHERVLDIARETLGAEADLVRIGPM